MQNYNFKFLIAILIFAFCILNLFALPVLADECKSGFVPCGRSCDDPKTDWNDTKDCEVVDIFRLLQKAISFMLLYGGIIASGFIAGGGVMMILARGNEQKVTQAKAFITNAVIGILIVFTAWIIINTIITVLGGSPNWNIIG